MMKRGQFMSEKKRKPVKQIYSQTDVIQFFSDDKNFDQDNKINRRNDKCSCSYPSEVTRVMRTKFP